MFNPGLSPKDFAKFKEKIAEQSELNKEAARELRNAIKSDIPNQIDKVPTPKSFMEFMLYVTVFFSAPIFSIALFSIIWHYTFKSDDFTLVMFWAFIVLLIFWVGFCVLTLSGISILKYLFKDFKTPQGQKKTPILGDYDIRTGTRPIKGYKYE